MTQPKSPFLVFQNFLSPKLCEQIVDDLDLFTPDEDHQGNPLPVFKHHNQSEELLFDHYEPFVDQIMQYYQTEGYRGTEQMQFEFYAPGTQGEVHCEGSDFLNRKWVRTRDRDLSAIIFLSNYNDDPPFDTEYEVYGGKVEFPQHHFGFLPERGTMIVFPSTPHFVNAVAPIVEGELFLVRFHVATHMPYMYDPEKFPGDYRTWFAGLY